MKVKKMVKRLFAVGAGATMLGATAMGALAADLSSYPDMFVSDGTFNGFFVVGENAAAVDNLAMTDIAASMKYRAPVKTSTVTVEGDAWLAGTSSKKLEMANSNSSDNAVAGETLRDIATFIGDEELVALTDGSWSTNEQAYEFQQFLFFDSTDTTSNIVKYTEADNDKTADHFLIKNADPFLRYKMEFSSVAQSDVTNSDGTATTTGVYLDDFEDTKLTFMGKEYTVVQARRPASTAENSVKLVLMAGATSDTLLEGESKSYTLGAKTYDVTLSYVDSTHAKFVVNGESTNKIADGQTYVLADGNEVGISDLLYQSYAGGIHSASFFIGAQKMELRDDNVESAGTGSKNLKIGSEDIDGTQVKITGTDDNTTFSISTIEINLTAEDDFFLAKDDKLSAVIKAAGEENEVLLGGALDVEYKGLTEETTHDIRLKTSSSRRYKLAVFDGDDKQVELPIAYAEGLGNFSVGEESRTNSRANQKRLIMNETIPIEKDDYFVVTDGTAASGSAKSYLLQYKGADDSDKTSPKIKFKNLGSSETLEYSVSTTNDTATIKLGGYSFAVRGVGIDLADDFPILVALNGDSDITDVAAVNFIDSYGAQVRIDYFPSNMTVNGTIGEEGDSVENQTSVRVNITVPNADDYDSFAPIHVAFNITAGTSDPELRAGLLAPVTLLTPDGVTEVSYGYTSLGAFLTFNEPASDPDELTYSYPKVQRLPQLYFTSGATSTSSSSAGDLTRVTIVDATKLDSEVASVSAQNLVVVGGPCVNSVAAELLGSPADCAQGFTPGKARVKLFEQANGNVAMLVAGYSGADTRLAGKVLAHRFSELTGDEVEIEGTTYSDATIGAPTPMVEEEPAVAPEADATTTQ
ncbi:TPA: hypothetical protein HA241_05715 [Candidatus Woesearchaeota archaeon]|nr:hypothetical protein [Candidatus Woesearchaeota archaeon]